MEADNRWRTEERERREEEENKKTERDKEIEKGIERKRSEGDGGENKKRKASTIIKCSMPHLGGGCRADESGGVGGLIQPRYVPLTERTVRAGCYQL
jgi:hypothetical protein